MKIALCDSMVFTDKMITVKAALDKSGHFCEISPRARLYANKTAEQIEALALKDKFENDAIREYLHIIKECDAVLVLNYDNHGIKNYVGGNTLIEIGFAHYWKKKIFLLNQMPDTPYCRSEIEAMMPAILNGDLDNFNF